MRSIESRVAWSRLAPAWITLCVAASFLAGAATAQVGSGAEPPSGGGGLRVTLERLGTFAYAGDPVLVRVAVFNTGDSPIDNASGLDLLGRTQVVNIDKGAQLDAVEGRSSGAASEPKVLAPGGFFGFITDLAAGVKGLDVPGRFKARLALPGIEPVEVDLVVIDRYDPAKAYRAVLETDFGKLAFDLLGGSAPRHVQNFHDLANQGYYDGTLIHAVVKGIEIHGGDRTGDGRSSPGYVLQPEIDAALKHGRGTLSMLRAGPTDHGAQFIIGLGENPRVDGVLSIFGSLAKGEEVLAALENLPTSGMRDAAPYRPLQQVTIQSIRVEPAPGGSAATPAGQGAAGS